MLPRCKIGIKSNAKRFNVLYQRKPRPHQQQCQSNIVKCYKSNDYFDKVECCFDKVERRFDIVAGVDEALQQMEFGIK